MSSRGMIEQVWTDSRIAGAMPRQPPGPGVLVLPPPPRPRTVDSELDLGHGGYMYGLIGEGKGDFEGCIGVDAFLWGCHAWRSLSRVLGVDLYCPLTMCQIREGWSRGDGAPISPCKHHECTGSAYQSGQVSQLLLGG